MRPSRPLSIRWWLGGLVAAVGLPLLILLALIYGLQVRRERAGAREEAHRIATSAAGRIRALHKESAALLRRMASRPAVRRLDSATCDSAFVVVNILPQYADLFLFNADGAVVCSATPDGDDRHTALLARQWIESELRRGRLPAEQPLIRMIDSHWITVLAEPVAGAGGARNGALVLVQLPEVFSEEVLPEKAVVTILDRAGTVVARSQNSHKWTGRNVRGAPIADIALGRGTGVAESVGIDGVSRQYAFQYLPELGWYLYVGIPTAEVMQPVRETFTRGIAGGVAIVLTVIVIAVVLSRAIERPLASLARAARSAILGSYGEVPISEGPREVVSLAELFNHMLRARAESEERTHDDEKKLKALSERLLVVQEEERTRIARELHDDLGQSLTALKMDVIGLMEKTDSHSPIAERILRTLDATVTSVQRISSELRPSILDDLGLAAALESEARLFEIRTGIECELSLADAAIDPRAATAIYRIVQEALTNVARHSNASRVEIRLRQRDGELLLDIRDDGRGVTGAEMSDPASLGLVGIRERADLMGGTAMFEGVANRGTIVSVRIPIQLTAGEPA
jgi:signal transduction histidine kinase